MRCIMLKNESMMRSGLLFSKNRSFKLINSSELSAALPFLLPGIKVVLAIHWRQPVWVQSVSVNMCLFIPSSLYSTGCHAAAVKPQNKALIWVTLKQLLSASFSNLLLFGPEYEPDWYLHTPVLLLLWAEGVLAALWRPVRAPHNETRKKL